MTLFVTKLAAAVAALGLAAPGAASAQDIAGVDERTGPVAFANAAAVRVTQVDGLGGGTVITETQRSPLGAGSSTLSQERLMVPKDDGERQSIGPNYVLSFGRMGVPSPLPADVPGRDHKITATLAENAVPSATAEGTYVLEDKARPSTEDTGDAVLVLQNARNTVECAGRATATGVTTADKLLVRKAGGLAGTESTDGTALTPVDLPAEGRSLELKGLPFGGALTLPDADPEVPVTSDLTISRLTAFDELIRQDEWRGADVTRAAAWQVDVVSHVTVKVPEGSPEETVADPTATSPSPGTSVPETTGSAEPVVREVREVRTKLVLGGVSCSVADGFVPALAAAAKKPGVPVRIPAGVAEAADGTPDDGAGAGPAALVGLVFIGGGAVLGGGAVWILRRRPTAARNGASSR